MNAIAMHSSDAYTKKKPKKREWENEEKQKKRHVGTQQV